MIRHPAVFLALLGLACADRTPPPDADAQMATADSLAEMAEAVPEPPPMPDHPGGRSGQLTARAVGAFELDRGWPARAGRCARPAMVVILAEEPGSGASILLQLPASSDLTGPYPVKLADSLGVPAPPASQLGFQFFEMNAADAYQAADGEVEVRELTDRRVTGRFTVTMRHVINDQIARVAGTFQQVAVEPLPPDWCERAAAAQDSLAVVDSTRVPG
ncbi:MAG TPA: hypothetical protein VGA02_05615 [Gemmatimonadales bacterium]|jgi:hypothetical protein